MNDDAGGGPSADPIEPIEPIGPSYPHAVTIEPVPRRRPAAVAGIVIGIVALLGGAMFAATSLTSGGGGASPEAAARQLFRAVGDGDALGVLDSLPPGE